MSPDLFQTIFNQHLRPNLDLSNYAKTPLREASINRRTHENASLSSVAEAQTFKTLYSFTNGSDGGVPMAGLILTGDTLYGTARLGGYLRSVQTAQGLRTCIGYLPPMAAWCCQATRFTGQHSEGALPMKALHLHQHQWHGFCDPGCRANRFGS